MTIQPLMTILTELLATMKTLANQHVPPILLDEELEMGDRALQSGVESQAFRAIEVLILSAYASGLTKEPVLQQDPAYIEAVQMLRMSGKPLPAHL
jgi:5-enolpyruvylshikimate-3-phosphate synthase